MQHLQGGNCIFRRVWRILRLFSCSLLLGRGKELAFMAKLPVLGLSDGSAINSLVTVLGCLSLNPIIKADTWPVYPRITGTCSALGWLLVEECLGSLWEENWAEIVMWVCLCPLPKLLKCWFLSHYNRAKKKESLTWLSQSLGAGEGDPGSIPAWRSPSAHTGYQPAPIPSLHVPPGTICSGNITVQIKQNL